MLASMEGKSVSNFFTKLIKKGAKAGKKGFSHKTHKRTRKSTKQNKAWWKL
jgi:hypothetical protein